MFAEDTPEDDGRVLMEKRIAKNEADDIADIMRIMMKLILEPVNNKQADVPSPPDVIAAGIVNHSAQLQKSQLANNVPDLLKTALLFASQEGNSNMDA